MRMRGDRTLRTDAARNRDVIVEATIETLTRHPRASVTEIAAAAGVGRATIYGHFASRGHLLAAAMRRATSRVDEGLVRIDPTHPPSQAFDDLVAASWWTLGQLAGVTAAVRYGADPSALRLLSDESRSRIQALILDGRAAGVFRSDQTLDWQIACFSAIVRAGASRTSNGTPPSAEAGSEMVATIRAMLEAVPGTSAADSPRPPAHPVDLP